MSALENAKAMGKAGVIARIAESGLLEFGVDRTPVAEKWNLVNEEREFQTNPIRVVAGLNNADTNGALLALLKENPERVFRRNGHCGRRGGRGGNVPLNLPEKEAAYAEEIADQAAARGIQVKTGNRQLPGEPGRGFPPF